MGYKMKISHFSSNSRLLDSLPKKHSHLFGKTS